jgi:hypothetical protein
MRMGDSPVMLSLVLSEANGAAKHLGPSRQILRFAQDDRIGADSALDADIRMIISHA